MKLEISEAILNNLKTFLGRVDLKGTEVPAFVEVINVLNNVGKEENLS